MFGGYLMVISKFYRNLKFEPDYETTKHNFECKKINKAYVNIKVKNNYFLIQ